MSDMLHGILELFESWSYDAFYETLLVEPGVPPIRVERIASLCTVRRSMKIILSSEAPKS